MVPATQLEPLAPSTPLLEVIEYPTADGIGACWVAQPEDPARINGLIPDGDLRRALQSQGTPTWSSLSATNLMTVDPMTLHGSTLAIKAIERMEQNHRKPISVLPVVDGENRMLGLLQLHDLVSAGLATTEAD